MEDALDTNESASWLGVEGHTQPVDRFRLEDTPTSLPRKWRTESSVLSRSVRRESLPLGNF